MRNTKEKLCVYYCAVAIPRDDGGDGVEKRRRENVGREENTSVFSDFPPTRWLRIRKRDAKRWAKSRRVAEPRRNTNYDALRAMALNLLDALFQSLNSIKSGNEVCRRSLSLSPSPTLFLSHSLTHSFFRLSSFPRFRIVRIYHALLLPFPPSFPFVEPLRAPLPRLALARTLRNCRAFQFAFRLGA